LHHLLLESLISSRVRRQGRLGLGEQGACHEPAPSIAPDLRLRRCETPTRVHGNIGRYSLFLEKGKEAKKQKSSEEQQGFSEPAMELNDAQRFSKH